MEPAHFVDVGELYQCVAVGGNQTAGKTNRQTGTVCDGVGDVTGQHRNHQAHGQAAYRLEEGCQGGDHTEVRAHAAVAADGIHQKGQSGEDTAANDKGKHVADAAHQMLIDLVAYAAFFFFRGGFAAPGFVVHFAVSGGRPGNQLFGLVDAVGNLHLDHLFPVKPSGGHLGVGGQDDTFGGCNFIRRQGVFHPAGAVGFHFNGNPQLLAGLL